MEKVNGGYNVNEAQPQKTERTYKEEPIYPNSVMDKGVVEQVPITKEILAEPADKFVKNAFNANFGATDSHREEAKNICENFYQSIDGLGTRDPQFEDALYQIDSDNIVDVLKQWNNTYGSVYNESFIDSFMGDAKSKQIQEFAPRLAEALREAGEMRGLNLDKLEAKVIHESKPRFHSPTVITGVIGLMQGKKLSNPPIYGIDKSTVQEALNNMANQVLEKQSYIDYAVQHPFGMNP